MSYTTFRYEALSITSTEATAAEDIKFTVTFDISNIGHVVGSEVVQVYIALPPTGWSDVHPKYQLKSFVKVKDLKPGEKRQGVCVEVGKYGLSYWDQSIGMWVIKAGSYGVFLGPSADTKRFELDGKIGVGRDIEWKGL